MWNDDVSFSVDITTARRPVFNPQFPVASTQIDHPARLYISEVNEPDAVPPLSYIDVGDPTEPIYRVIQLMDNTLVLKSSSAWILSGEWPNTRVQRLDASLQLVSPDSVAVVAGQVMALTTQGVVTVGTSGIGLVGVPVEEDFEFIQVGANRRLPFGVGYESEKLYVLGVPQGPAETTCSTLYVYHTLLKTWTRWTLNSMSGWYSRSTNSLRLGDAVARGVRSERKTFTREDYKDERLKVTTTNVNLQFNYALVAGTVVKQNSILNFPIVLLGIGDLVVTASGVTAKISDIDTGAGTVTLDSGKGYLGSTGTFTAYKKFDTEIEYLPETASDPSKAKMAKEMVAHYAKLAGTGTLGILSELAPVPFASKVYNRSGYGLMLYGTAPFGDPSGPRNERAAFRWDSARGAYPVVRLTTSQAEAYFKLNGKTLKFEQSASIDKR